MRCDLRKGSLQYNGRFWRNYNLKLHKILLSLYLTYPHNIVSLDRSKKVLFEFEIFCWYGKSGCHANKTKFGMFFKVGNWQFSESGIRSLESTDSETGKFTMILLLYAVIQHFKDRTSVHLNCHQGQIHDKYRFWGSSSETIIPMPFCCCVYMSFCYTFYLTTVCNIEVMQKMNVTYCKIDLNWQILEQNGYLKLCSWNDSVVSITLLCIEHSQLDFLHLHWL